jgi:hypothetical protein
VLVAVLWGVLLSPKAPVSLPAPVRFGLEVVVFAVGVGALYLAGQPVLALAFVVVVTLNRALISVWHQ